MCFIAYTTFKKTACGNFRRQLLFHHLFNYHPASKHAFLLLQCEPFPLSFHYRSMFHSGRGITSFSTSFGSAPITFNSFTNVSIVGVFTSRSIAQMVGTDIHQFSTVSLRNSCLFLYLRIAFPFLSRTSSPGIY